MSIELWRNERIDKLPFRDPGAIGRTFSFAPNPVLVAESRVELFLDVVGRGDDCLMTAFQQEQLNKIVVGMLM